MDEKFNPEEHVERDEKTLRIFEVCGKTIYTIMLPDWDLLYVNYDTSEEKDLIRKTLFRLGGDTPEVRVARVTDQRIYFEYAY